MTKLIIEFHKGFGVTARSTAEARRLDPTGITTFRQADIGEYLREVKIGILFNLRSFQLTQICRKTPCSPHDLPKYLCLWGKKKKFPVVRG